MHAQTAIWKTAAASLQRPGRLRWATAVRWSCLDLDRKSNANRTSPARHARGFAADTATAVLVSERASINKTYVDELIFHKCLSVLVVQNLVENIHSCESIGDDCRTRTCSARQILKRSRFLLWCASRGHEAGNTSSLPQFLPLSCFLFLFFERISLFLFTGKKTRSAMDC